MSLALFDMDGTLIDGDTNDLSLHYFLEHGLVNEEFVRPLYQYAQDFFAGTLNISKFISYITSPFHGMSCSDLDDLMHRTVTERILPRLRPGAVRAVEEHLRRGDTPVIVTSTVDYLTEHVAAGLGIRHHISAQIKRENGRLTGEVILPVPYQQMKVTLIEEFARSHGMSTDGCAAYGDSINDLPMLRIAESPLAVNPQPELKARLEEFGIPSADWGHPRG